MKTFHLRKHSRTLWKDPKLQRKWVRSVVRLGTRWLLAEQVEKKTA